MTRKEGGGRESDYCYDCGARADSKGHTDKRFTVYHPFVPMSAANPAALTGASKQVGGSTATSESRRTKAWLESQLAYAHESIRALEVEIAAQKTANLILLPRAEKAEARVKELEAKLKIMVDTFGNPSELFEVRGEDSG